MSSNPRQRCDELERRLTELEQENLFLRMKTQDIASANVTAAMELVEQLEERASELEAENSELKRALHHAEKVSEQKSRFLATMSHELRTPISGVIGMAELLSEGSLNDQQRDRVQAIRHTSESFLDLVNQLLDYSKAEADAVVLESVEFDLWRVNEAVAQLLQVNADEKGVELHFYLDPELPRMVTGDPLRMRQVALNLGVNAVKFTSQGIVGMAVRKVVDAEGREFVEWMVDDSGCGFDEATGQRLFQPFTQAEASTTRKHGGTGLGLAISRNLVRCMQGTIDYASEPGKGSTFTVRLPLVTEQPVPKLPEPKRCARLVVARPGTEMLLADHLPRIGYRIADAGAADEQTPDLVVLEPASDAPLALEQLRADLPDVPVVLVECPGSEVPQDDYEDLGVIGMLQRPPRPTQLMALLAQEGGPSVPEVAAAFVDTRVLVVDDSKINLVALTGQLRRLGCEVSVAEDGQQGVAKYRAAPFDLVFLDCQMPIMDGYDAAREIRWFERSSGRSRSPLIALTADGSSDNKVHCRDAGMDDFMMKPCRMADLEGVLSKWITIKA